MGLSEVLVAGLLAIAPLVPCPALADEAARSRAREALERTERRIELADGCVSETPTAPATEELVEARQGQVQARSAFMSTEYPVCMSATRLARDHADRAIAIVRNLPDPDRVQVQVVRTRDVLERARHRVEACVDPRASTLLSVALGMQERAEGALTESRYLAALQLTMSARERVVKATSLCAPGDPLADSTARALRRTDELLVRTRGLLEGAPSPLGRDRLARAQALQAQAQTEARGERHGAALRLTGQARVLAQQALRPGRALRELRAR